MIFRVSIRTLLAIAMLIGGFVSNFAVADQNDPRLPALFETLQTASNPLEASSTEQEIWRIWHTSPNDEALAIMRAQASRDDRLKIADDVIVNEGNPDALDAEIDILHQRYLALAAQQV